MSLFITKMQTQARMRYHFTPTKMAIIKNYRQHQTLSRMWGNCALLVGMQNGAAIMKQYGFTKN